MDTGDTAWVLASAALVLLMTPGLAFFYGGMTRSKSVLNMMMMSFAALAIVPILWVLYGYSFAFGPGGNGLLGGLEHLAFDGVGIETAYGTIPEFVFAGFQLMFAVLTVALISGAIADRATFTGWIAFIVVWATVVYFPVAHWVFDFGDSGGWIATKLEAVDFAGGTAVHINAGAAGLALALVLGKRVGWKREPMRPHNLPFVLLGAGLLWFGWIGFNAGLSTETGEAGLIIVNTLAAPAAGIVGWILVDVLRRKKPGVVGAASGAVAGLVAITPSALSLSPVWALLLGLIAGLACAFAIDWKYRLGYDDSLDVVGLHLVAGVIGSLYLGFFAFGDGLLVGGGAGLLLVQTISVLAVAAYSFVVSLLIALGVKAATGLRVPAEVEQAGIDEHVHGEMAYVYESTEGELGQARV